MPTIPLTAPAAEPLTLAQTRQHLREALPEDDDLIVALMRAAREALERATGLSLVARDVAEFRDGWPQGLALELSSWPVMQVKELAVTGADGASSVVDPSHWYLDNASRPARLVLREGRQLPRPGIAAHGIRIKLTAGFGSPEQVPEDIRQALLLQVKALHDARNGQTRALCAEAARLLAPFRRIRL